MFKKKESKEKEQVAEPKAKPAAAAVIEAMTDGVLILDMDGNIVSVNPAYLKMSGHKREELIGRSAAEMMEEDKVDPKTVERMMELIGEVIKTGGVSEPVEIFIQVKGKKIVLAATGSVIKDAEGNPINLVATLRDITELKRLQEKEKAAAAENARAEEAEKYSKELEKKIRDLERFQKVTMDREKRVIELKNEVKELKRQLEEVA